MSLRVMGKVLIVGSGLTGAATGCFLREKCPDLEVAIWDKAKGIGGRMSTTRSPNNNDCSVDLGAQYISVTPEYKNKYSRLYDDLLSKGLLSPLSTEIEGDRTTNVTHYVTPGGCSTLVKYFIQNSGIEVNKDHHVNRVEIKGDKSSVTVGTQSGHTEEFDTVILTMPVPQILQLQGSIQNLLDSKPKEKKLLEAVQYSSRFCLGLFYKAGVGFNVPWSAKYIPNHPCLRYVSIDTKKRGVGTERGQSVLVHTSVPYGIANIDRDKDEVKPEIYDHFTRMFPDFPQPDHVKGHKWRYSQVFKAYEGTPGCLLLEKSPLLVCGGDGFTHSKFDGCLDSAQAIVDTILQQKAYQL